MRLMLVGEGEHRATRQNSCLELLALCSKTFQ